MASFVKYTTKEGDRIDLIALAAFGNSHNWEPIISANPGLPLSESFGPGVVIKIPVISKQEAKIANNQTLPPWKQ